MSDFDEAVGQIEGKPPIAQPPQQKKKRAAPKKVTGPVNETSVAAILRKSPKVRIVIEENEGIPPGGQFISINGFAYNIIPGEEVDVPEQLLDVLDNARVSRPIRNKHLQIVGYRQASRVPYRIVRKSKKGGKPEE